MVRHSQFGGGYLRKLLKRIYLYFKGKEIWDAKMVGDGRNGSMGG